MIISLLTVAAKRNTLTRGVPMLTNFARGATVNYAQTNVNLADIKLLGFAGAPAASEQHIHLPTANVRKVFNQHSVEKLLAKLPAKDHESLRTVYERMIERGPERFQVKPSGIPEMEHLYAELPNFEEPLDEVKRSIALCLDSEDGLEVTPILLLGPPGIGKTLFAGKIAELFGTGMSLVPMSSMTAGWILSGASSQWRGARPGKVFDALVNGHYANPVIVVDEVDKAASQVEYNPLGALYSLLERDTASTFTDEFAEVPIDASQVIWVLTANDERSIPEPIMNRMNVFQVREPTRDEARRIADNLYKEIRRGHGWGKRFGEDPGDDLLDRLAAMAPREMRRALMTGFGNARLSSRNDVTVEDLQERKSGKQAIGFVQN